MYSAADFGSIGPHNLNKKSRSLRAGKRMVEPSMCPHLTVMPSVVTGFVYAGVSRLLTHPVVDRTLHRRLRVPGAMHIFSHVLETGFIFIKFIVHMARFAASSDLGSNLSQLIVPFLKALRLEDKKILGVVRELPSLRIADAPSAARALL